METRGLTKIYGRIEALSEVTLGIPAGATGLLGPNGAGKSTLIRSLIGLVRPDRGCGTIFGQDITSAGLSIRRRIGYMPEHECLIGDMKAIEMVAYVGQISGMPRSDAMQRAHEVLHFVGIGDERYRTIDGYSTGMKQKVNLAQALVHDPDLLFLDEPTNGLDPKGRTEMLELIRFLASEAGKSIILSSHILRDVEHVCDHIVVLSGGRILMQGSFREYLGYGDTGVNVRMQGDVASFAGWLRWRGYEVDDRDSNLIRVSPPGTGDEADPDYPHRLFRDIMQAGAETGSRIRFVSRRVTDLEDLFMDLVRSGERNAAPQEPGPLTHRPRGTGTGGVT